MFYLRTKLSLGFSCLTSPLSAIIIYIIHLSCNTIDVQLVSVAKSPLVTNSLPSCEKLPLETSSVPICEKLPFETNSLLIICTFSTKPCALTLVAAEFLLNWKSPLKSSSTDTLSIEPTKALPTN